MIPTLDELLEARDELKTRAAPLHAKRAELLAQIQPLEANLRETNKAIHAIERPALVEIEQLLQPIILKQQRTAASGAA